MEDFFRDYIASSKHEGELGEFKTVMQTRNAVEGLKNKGNAVFFFILFD